MFDEKKSLEKLNKDIEEILYKHSGISPKETQSNTMVGVKKPISFYWRPNNYRFTAPYNKESFNPTLPPTLAFQFQKGSVQLKVSNYGTKHSCKNFNGSGITVVADKNSITTIYSLKSAVSQTKLERAWYLIEAGSIQEMNEWIDNKVEEIKQRCIEQIKTFVKLYGGNVDLQQAAFKRQENEIHGEDYVDRIPKHMIIHDTYFKKVYPHGIELKSEADVKRYIGNRLVEDLAPEIGKELHNVKETMGLMSDNLLKQSGNISFLAENINTHIPAIKTLADNVERFTDIVEQMEETKKPKRKYRHPSELMELPNWMRKNATNN